LTDWLLLDLIGAVIVMLIISLQTVHYIGKSSAHSWAYWQIFSILTCSYKCKSQPSVKGYMIASCLVGVNKNKLVHILLIKGLLRVFDGDQLGGKIFPLHLLSLTLWLKVDFCICSCMSILLVYTYHTRTRV
jgi:hypothetical protein